MATQHSIGALAFFTNHLSETLQQRSFCFDPEVRTREGWGGGFSDYSFTDSGDAKGFGKGTIFLDLVRHGLHGFKGGWYVVQVKRVMVESGT